MVLRLEKTHKNQKMKRLNLSKNRKIKRNQHKSLINCWEKDHSSERWNKKVRKNHRKAVQLINIQNRENQKATKRDQHRIHPACIISKNRKRSKDKL